MVKCDRKKCKHRPVTYEGPVKIVLIEPEPTWIDKRALAAACLGLATLLIGAAFVTLVIASVIYYRKYWHALHFISCAIGFQLYMPIGMMGINPLFGSTNPMKNRDRKKEHMYSELLALFFIIVGCLFVYLAYCPEADRYLIYLKETTSTSTTTTTPSSTTFNSSISTTRTRKTNRPPRTRAPRIRSRRTRIRTTTQKRKTLQQSFLSSVHSITGIIACLLTLLTLLLAPFVWHFRENMFFCAMRRAHILFALLAFIISSVCFCTGMLKFKNRLMVTKEVINFTCAVCCVYTVIVVYGPVMQMIKKCQIKC